MASLENIKKVVSVPKTNADKSYNRIVEFLS